MFFLRGGTFSAVYRTSPANKATTRLLVQCKGPLSTGAHDIEYIIIVDEPDCEVPASDGSDAAERWELLGHNVAVAFKRVPKKGD